MEALSKVKAIQQRNEIIGEVFAKHFGIETSENPGYKAWATYAKDVGVRLVSMLIAARHPDSGRTLSGFMDLTYHLSANDFWSKNAQVLVPLLMASLNGIRDAAELSHQRDQIGEYAMYDDLISAGKLASLELFSVMLLLVGGPALMTTHSMPMKLDLAPHLGM